MDTTDIIRFYVLLSHSGWGIVPLIGAVGFGFLIGRLRQAWRVRRSIGPLVALILAWGLLLINVWLCLAGFLHFGCAAFKARQSQCFSNVKKLSAAMLMYAQDYDDHFPPAGQWNTLLQHYQKETLRCPDAVTSNGYGMNKALGKTSCQGVEFPVDTVLLFESEVLAGGPSDQAPTRHGGGTTVGFVDGHAKWVYAKTKLRWTNTPEPKSPAR
ncbi:MAG: hypothetical protein QM758_18705 [Armatimonas sp.]